jgi:hypothetical protein
MTDEDHDVPWSVQPDADQRQRVDVVSSPSGAGIPHKRELEQAGRKSLR